MKIPIVFFGAGPVASKSLRLLSKNFSIETVITKGNAHSKPKDYPVIAEAKDLNLQIYFANTKQEVDNCLDNNIFTSKLGILIDYGVIVSEKVINSFPMGIVNSHFSLLPQWRGADPITFSLLSGQQATGVSLMLLSKGMDEGPIISQEKLTIDNNETGITLTDKLIYLSDKMLKNYVPVYLTGEIKPKNQLQYAKENGLETEPTYSTKISKIDGQINWLKSAVEIEREVRAYQPWPKSYTEIGENILISITKSRIDTSKELKPAQVYKDKKQIIIGTSRDSLEILEVQPAGKNKMPTEDFLRGYSSKLYSKLI